MIKVTDEMLTADEDVLGSPVDLRYRFRLAGERVAALDIG